MMNLIMLPFELIGILFGFLGGIFGTIMGAIGGIIGVVFSIIGGVIGGVFSIVFGVLGGILSLVGSVFSLGVLVAVVYVVYRLIADRPTEGQTGAQTGRE